MNRVKPIDTAPSSIAAAIFRRLSPLGVIGATVFFAGSLTPSLIPRGPLFQGVVSGISFVVGYVAAALLAHTSAFLVAPTKLRLHHRVKTTIWLACSLTLIAFLGCWPNWQNDTRGYVGMAPESPWQTVPMLAYTFLVAAAGLGLGRSMLWVVTGAGRALSVYLPPRLAWLFATLAIVAAAWLLLSGVVFRAAFHLADASFQGLDEHISPDMAPMLDNASGVSASLIDWKTLGNAGRRYLSSAPSRHDINRYARGDAVQPVRVYAGLNSAETAEARANIALRQLIRAGGFERSVLVVIAPTGTGWIDPRAIDTFEYVQHGDVASVAIQYSYLPSWLSLFSEPDNGTEAATALFRQVYSYWTKLPRHSRPRLYLFGLSLGALGSEEAMDMLDVVADPVDGALWAGPPFQSKLWRFATARRDVGSPPWLPRFRDGSIIRFFNHGRQRVEQTNHWGPIRIAYLQYGSDPITFFEPNSWYRKPSWMKSPRASDVSPRMRWIPIVSFMQLIIDMAGATETPPGYGHVYACSDYLNAWIALTGPKKDQGSREAAICKMYISNDK